MWGNPIFTMTVPSGAAGSGANSPDIKFTGELTRILVYPGYGQSTSGQNTVVGVYDANGALLFESAAVGSGAWTNISLSANPVILFPGTTIYARSAGDIGEGANTVTMKLYVKMNDR